MDFNEEYTKCITDAQSELYDLFEKDVNDEVCRRNTKLFTLAALDRLIPAEPFKTTFGKYNCPMCDDHLEKHDFYCPNCGQRIDWSSQLDPTPKKTFLQRIQRIKNIFKKEG